MKYLTYLFLILFTSIGAQGQEPGQAEGQAQQQGKLQQMGLGWVASAFDLKNADNFFISSETRLSLAYELDESWRLKGHVGYIDESILSQIINAIFSFGETPGEISGYSFGIEAQYDLSKAPNVKVLATTGLTQYNIYTETHSQTTFDHQTRALIGLHFVGIIGDAVGIDLALAKEYEINGQDESRQVMIGMSFNL